MDSKRLAVLKALTTHLETEVAIANGYQYDLAGHVFRGRLYFAAEESVPQISIIEALNPDRDPRRAGHDDGVQPPQHNENWVLLVQGWDKDDKLNPTDPAHGLMADVKKALAKLVTGPNPMTGLGGHAAYRLGGLINGLELEPGTVRPPEEISSRAFFYIRVIVNLADKIADPYDVS
jgi:hypothetical protein